MPGIHHVEIWIADLDQTRREWGWLLERLGFERGPDWADGSTWAAGGSYVTFTTSPNLAAAPHDRRRPGLNHLALWGGTRAEVDAVMMDAGSHGWTPLYHERYPHAGGPDHYAGWLENSAGFKAEIVAEGG
ncbi:VOC family protein [Microbacterium invictum]|uniref:Catechol 2,3-dioxygenase-like lactoylglutathione lyase family enzyme n=1 Tax=Microbacterium invictum TaxID=515415 RepID=A0AA40SMZ8_9MICO|nr:MULTISPECIES: VOC family protein [Microbacterium]MBB4139178.1 catechol 2,3-dioxygenase-like lactoylglutathione lyase family enzyme [Microbacterium invictum]